MSRPLRILYHNAWYHVMNRGAGRQTIFRHDDHRKMFLEILKESCKMFNIEIHAYCLMSNHYHLLLKTPDANLSRAMSYINGVYTLRYNRIISKDGALFRGRYKAKLIEDDCYQLIVSRYIHLNPVEAKIVKKAECYAWSSYQYYIGLDEPPSWLSTDIILQQVATRVGLSHVANYQEYVEQTDFSEINTFYSEKYTSPIIGSKLFIEEIISKVEVLRVEATTPDFQRAKTIPKFSVISKKVCECYLVDETLIYQSKRGYENWPRNLFMYLCRKEFGYTLKSIAQYLGNISHVAVGSAIQKCVLLFEIYPDKYDRMIEVGNEIRKLQPSL